MPVALTGNMRSHTTARVGAAIMKEVRLGAYFGDTKLAQGTMRVNQYKWLMVRGVKPLDVSGVDENDWTELQR